MFLFCHMYNEDNSPDLLDCVYELLCVKSHVEPSEQSKLEEMMARVDSGHGDYCSIIEMS